MKTYIYLLFIGLYFTGNNAFAQRPQKTNEAYKNAITFKYDNQTWVFTAEKSKDGKPIKDSYFLEQQKQVIDLKKDNAYEIAQIKGEEKYNLSKYHPELKDVRLKLKYYILSCGFMDVQAYLIKKNNRQMVFAGRGTRLVFTPKK